MCPIGVATVAVSAVVDVVAHAAVLRRNRAGWVTARGATEDGVVGRIRVALGAAEPFVRAAGDGEPGMVERRAGPARRGVAGLASGRESRGLVIGIRGRIVNRDVAAVAILRRALVDVIHVA